MADPRERVLSIGKAGPASLHAHVGAGTARYQPGALWPGREGLHVDSPRPVPESMFSLGTAYSHDSIVMAPFWSCWCFKPVALACVTGQWGKRGGRGECGDDPLLISAPFSLGRRRCRCGHVEEALFPKPSRGPRPIRRPATESSVMHWFHPSSAAPVAPTDNHGAGLPEHRWPPRHSAHAQPSVRRRRPDGPERSRSQRTMDDCTRCLRVRRAGPGGRGSQLCGGASGRTPSSSNHDPTAAVPSMTSCTDRLWDYHNWVEHLLAND